MQEREVEIEFNRCSANGIQHHSLLFPLCELCGHIVFQAIVLTATLQRVGKSAISSLFSSVSSVPSVAINSFSVATQSETRLRPSTRRSQPKLISRPRRSPVPFKYEMTCAKATSGSLLTDFTSTTEVLPI